MNAINRIINPVEINYNGMIIFAIFGVVINFLAAYFTREGDSINQRSVNLHMLEDVLGWVVVLIGAIIMRFTDISLIDAIMSIGVAVFILVHSLKNLKSIVDLFLEKTPNNVSIDEIKEHLLKIKDVKDDTSKLVTKIEVTKEMKLNEDEDLEEDNEKRNPLLTIIIILVVLLLLAAGYLIVKYFDII